MLLIERKLPAPPAAAFPWLAEPELMNRWSRARIVGVALGDRGAPWGTGALRSVILKAGGTRLVLREVIERSVPPTLLAYRVFAGAPVRSHRGVITLEAEGSGSRLRWKVEMEPIVPGTRGLLERMLRPDLEASVDKLAELVRGAPVVDYSPEEDLSDEHLLAELYDDAERVLVAQRELAERLARADDPRSWFARVYELVTENQLLACRGGGVRHVAWVLRLLPRFHDFYIENMERALGLRAGEVEGHWRRALRSPKKLEDPRALRFAIGRSLFLGVKAHVEDDLPRALASVWHRHYRARASYGRLRADYLAMTELFRDASRKLSAMLPKGLIPFRVRALAAVLPRELNDRIEARYYYDLQKRRREAFERGARLASWLSEEAGTTTT